MLRTALQSIIFKIPIIVMFEKFRRAGEAAVLSLPLTACATTLDTENAPSLDHQPAEVTIRLSEDFYGGFQVQRRLDNGIFSLNNLNSIHAYSSNGYLELTLKEGFTAETSGKATLGNITIKSPDITAGMPSVIHLETTYFTDTIVMQVISGELVVGCPNRTFMVREGGLIELRGEIQYHCWEDFDAGPHGIRHIVPKIRETQKVTNFSTRLSAEQFPTFSRDER